MDMATNEVNNTLRTGNALPDAGAPFRSRPDSTSLGRKVPSFLFLPGFRLLDGENPSLTARIEPENLIPRVEWVT